MTTGDLVLLQLPSSSQATPKVRPGLVLGAAELHGDLIVAFVTSEIATCAGLKHALVVDPADLAEGQMLRPSAVRLDKTITVQPQTVVRRVGRLNEATLRKALQLWNAVSSRSFSRHFHTMQRPGTDAAHAPFVAGQTTVPYAGRVFTEDEVEAAVNSTLDFWLTLGPEGDAFESELAKFLGVKKSILVNSGSSANLLAISALTSPKLGERQLRPGHEVITVAAGFPTTVAPILQNGLRPVFIDNDPSTLNARVDQLEEAFVEGKTKAVMMAHTLGNPFDLAAVTAFCERHGLWLIEDNCDALGCSYDGKFTGTFGDLSTQSFYPPHHLTLGEGGAVNVTRDMKLKVLVESFRDWGRDCWCPSGKDNTCHKRFGWQLGELPAAYDHKYIYSHLGYNLKPLDPQAAIGRQQLRKLPSFVEARIRNWETLRRGLAPFEDRIAFQLPTHATSWTPEGFSWDTSGHRSLCSWFGFMMLVRKDAPFSRRQFVQALDDAKIGSRMLFGGNLVRQPAFVGLRAQQPDAFRVVGDLAGADRIMNEAVFIGTYPGLTPAMLDYIIETIARFIRKF